MTSARRRYRPRGRRKADADWHALAYAATHTDELKETLVHATDDGGRIPCRGEYEHAECQHPTRWGGWDFERCPFLAMRSPRWVAVVEEFHASRVSPLAGWPDGYAAWVQDGLAALAVQHEARMARARAGG